MKKILSIFGSKGIISSRVTNFISINKGWNNLRIAFVNSVMNTNLNCENVVLKGIRGWKDFDAGWGSL